MTETTGKALDFVRKLAISLGRDEIDLPAFPDVVQRLQITLANENSSAKDVVQIMASEPLLTSKLMRMANSAALNPKGTEIDNLGAAVSRLGFNTVRSTATAYAMHQMKQQKELADIRDQLDDIWKGSNRVAATCYVLAKKGLKQRPDEALLAGLLHQIGRLYILMHAHRDDPQLMACDEYKGVVESMQAGIGKAILESWKIPDAICEAVEGQDTLLNEGEIKGANLTSLLSAASLRNRIASDPNVKQSHPEAEDLILKVNFGDSNFAELIGSHGPDIEAMQSALAA